MVLHMMMISSIRNAVVNIEWQSSISLLQDAGDMAGRKIREEKVVENGGKKHLHAVHLSVPHPPSPSPAHHRHRHHRLIDHPLSPSPPDPFLLQPTSFSFLHETMVYIRWNQLLFLPFSLRSVAGFASYDGSRSVKNQSSFPSFATAPGDVDVDVVTSLDGVDDFEKWFAANSLSGAQVKNIQHALFRSTGRGLQFTSTKSTDLKKVAVVPRKLVLHVPYSDDADSTNQSSWDSSLSCKLWEECQRGKDSPYYG